MKTFLFLFWCLFTTAVHASVTINYRDGTQFKLTDKPCTYTNGGNLGKSGTVIVPYMTRPRIICWSLNEQSQILILDVRSGYWPIAEYQVQ